jgi:hypothetical protein
LDLTNNNSNNYKKENTDTFVVDSLSNVSKQILMVQEVMGKTTDALKIWVQKIHDQQNEINTLSKKIETLSSDGKPVSDNHINKLISMNKDLVKLIEEENHIEKDLIPNIKSQIKDISNEIKYNNSNISQVQNDLKTINQKQKSFEKSLIKINPKTNDYVTFKDLFDFKTKFAKLTELNKRIVNLVSLTKKDNSSNQPKIINQDLKKDIELIKQTLNNHSEKIFKMNMFENDELKVLVKDLEQNLITNKNRIDRIESSALNVERELSEVLKMNSRFVRLLNRKEQVETKEFYFNTRLAKKMSELSGNISARLNIIEDKIENISNTKEVITQDIQIPNNINEKLNEVLSLKKEMSETMNKTKQFVSLISKKEALSIKQENILKRKEQDLENLIEQFTNILDKTKQKQERLDTMIAQGQQIFTLLKKKEKRTESELDIQLDNLLNKI